MVPGSEPAVQVYPGTPFDCVNSWDCHYLLFYGRAYDMVVSYTIRQEQDRSAETAPLIEESIQKVLDVFNLSGHFDNFTSNIFDIKELYIFFL